jgi:hypothetical protein
MTQIGKDVRKDLQLPLHLDGDIKVYDLLVPGIHILATNAAQ